MPVCSTVAQVAIAYALAPVAVTCMLHYLPTVSTLGEIQCCRLTVLLARRRLAGGLGRRTVHDGLLMLQSPTATSTVQPLGVLFSSNDASLLQPSPKV